MLALPALAPADSARVVAHVYGASLLALVPLAVALVAALLLRGASARGRAMVARAAVVSLLVVFAARLLPLEWGALALPSALAAPLVELGRADVAAEAASPALHLLLAAYLAGVALVLVRAARELLAARALVRASHPAGPRWQSAARAAARTLGLHRAVRVVVSRDARVPCTVGLLRPVVVLPPAALAWSAEHRRALLLHELAHVRAWDVAFGLLARLACALYWFHPGAWWVARGLRAECEQACDERVLAAGVKPSAYASLLVRAADLLHGAPAPAVALVARRGLRARLAAVVAPARATAGVRGALLAASLVVLAALPAGTAELAPGRDLLERLLTDARWETRAWAVAGLAARPDSLEIARAAALSEPDPRARAFAERALVGR